MIIPFINTLSRESETLWLEHLNRHAKDFEVRPFVDLTTEQRSRAETAIVAKPVLNEINQLKNLIWLQSLWAGIDDVILHIPEHIQVARLNDPQLAKTMAEAVLTWTLWIHRQGHVYQKQQAEKTWIQHSVKRPNDVITGVLGLGALGAKACSRLVENGFNVHGWSRNKKELPAVQTYSGREGLASLLKIVDILIVLLPLTTQTKGLLDLNHLQMMSPSAALINFSRGPIIDSPALKRQLDLGKISHAVLDVFDEEPLPPSSSWWTHEAVTLTPHISAPTDVLSASEIVVGNIELYLTKNIQPTFVSRQLGY